MAVSRLKPLCADTRGSGPPCCTDCVFWQHRSRAVDPDLKRRWAAATEKTFGPWGCVLDEGGAFRGLIQYGPAAVFGRARTLPAGPPSRDAALITCAYVQGDDLSGTCERLLLEALADLKARGVAAAEAFALGFPDDVDADARSREHHTLFDRDQLERLGFQPVRAAGQVTLMRLPLGGLEPSLLPALAARLARPLRNLQVSFPAPATLRADA